MDNFKALNPQTQCTSMNTFSFSFLELYLVGLPRAAAPISDGYLLKFTFLVISDANTQTIHNFPCVTLLENTIACQALSFLSGPDKR